MPQQQAGFACSQSVEIAIVRRRRGGASSLCNLCRPWLPGTSRNVCLTGIQSRLTPRTPGRAKLGFDRPTTGQEMD